MYYFFSRYSFLLFIIGLYLVAALYLPTWYILLTYEDLYGEWSQTLFFGVAFAFAARLFLARSSYRWFFLALAISCLYVFMEEISWGQRLFGIATPEFFKQHNLQREINLHNMLTGPYASDIKAFLEYLITAGLIGYGVVYPILLKFRCGIARFVETLKIPAPPLYLAPYFLAAAVLEPEPFRFNEAEIAELLTAVALTLLTVHYWYAQRFSLLPHADAKWPQNYAARYMGALWTVLLLVLVSAFLITTLLYQSPDMQRRIDNRIYNGYKKFALRYQSYKQWDIANDLLLKVYRKNPEDTANLRAIASNYRRMDDKEAFAEYNGMAIKAGLKRYRQNPQNIAANLSLAKSYRQRGDFSEAQRYVKNAYLRASVDAKKHPDSPYRAYWLGQSLESLGMYQKAYLQYKKAVRLNPSRSDYRKAYLKAERRIKKLTQ